MSKSKHFNGPWEGKRGLSVEVRNEFIDVAIRHLSRKLKQEGLMRELRRRSYYEKPSVVRRRKKSEAVARWKKVRDRFDDR